MPGLVRCGNCSELLAEPSDLPESAAASLSALRREAPDVREEPCRDGCRERRGGGRRLGRERPRGQGYPTGSIARLEDAGFDLQWLRLSEGGAWMVRVFDRHGTWIDGSIQDDPQEALLAVCERLLPPQNRPSNRINPAVAIIVGLEKIRAARGA
jgi:hypothetical protein